MYGVSSLPRCRLVYPFCIDRPNPFSAGGTDPGPCCHQQAVAQVDPAGGRRRGGNTYQQGTIMRFVQQNGPPRPINQRKPRP